MRIAIVGTELCAVDARGGGLEQVLRRWASDLSARHDVVVVTHRPGRRPLAVDGDRYPTVVIDRPADLATMDDVDVVSLHNRPQWARLCAPGPDVAVTFHNYPAAWKTTRPALPDGVRASAVSEALAGAATAVVGVPVAVVPPSIDPVFCVPRSWTHSPVVLSPNRLMRKKGVLELLAIARRPEFAEVMFLFADLISPWLRPTGEHKALRAAIAEVANATLFAPAADAAALADRYASAGVVACAVREEEGLGLVALEAQACGAPLVTTDLGGLREATFAPNECVSALDEEALAAALGRALDRREPGSAARDAVLARHSPEASARSFEEWLVRRR